jgi:NRPS condensation-like uncharacterized protein
VDESGDHKDFVHLRKCNNCRVTISRFIPIYPQLPARRKRKAHRISYSPAVKHTPLTRTRFNTVDEALHIVDTADAGQPLSIQFEVRAPGRLDEARLRAAVAAACRVHPMARARQASWKPTDDHYEWEITETIDVDPVRIVDVGDALSLEQERAELQSRCVSLAESPPFRVVLARHPGGDYLMLNVNHSASDGVGTLRLMRSIVRAYAGEADPTPDVDPLAIRDLQVELAPSTLKERLRGWQGMIDSWSRAATLPTHVVPDGGTDEAGFGFHHLLLTVEQTADLNPKRHIKGTVNDLLLAALAQTIENWNTAHHAACKRIGLMMPVNVRPRDRWYEVVGNFAGDVTISTSRSERTNAKSLMSAIVSQTQRAKDDGTAAAVLAALAGGPVAPIGVRRALTALLAPSAERYMNSCVLSNVGRVDEAMSFGDAGVGTELWFSPPNRSPMGLSLGVAFYADRLHLAFRYCRSQFGAAEVAHFSGLYHEALRELG